MLRHIGTIQNTGSRVIVAFMQLPDAPQKCLVIQVDTLPEYYKETVNRLVQSEEGQQAGDFALVLSRHKVEGQNRDMLSLFHQTGQLIALPIDNVLMTPVPSVAVPLREVLIQMGKNVPNRPTAQSDQYAQPKKFNQFEENQQADLNNNRQMMAQAKLRQAQLMEDDARRYRNEAYELAPNLRPMQTVSAPAPVAAPEPVATDYTQQVSELSNLASSYSDDGQLDLFGLNNGSDVQSPE